VASEFTPHYFIPDIEDNGIVLFVYLFVSLQDNLVTE